MLAAGERNRVHLARTLRAGDQPHRIEFKRLER
jgi:ABC-type hemin transport system ATPase subunit